MLHLSFLTTCSGSVPRLLTLLNKPENAWSTMSLVRYANGEWPTLVPNVKNCVVVLCPVALPKLLSLYLFQTHELALPELSIATTPTVFWSWTTSRRSRPSPTRRSTPSCSTCPSTSLTSRQTAVRRRVAASRIPIGIVFWCISLHFGITFCAKILW